MSRKFKDVFKKPVYLSDGTYVIDGELAAKDAAYKIEDFACDNVTADKLERDFVRFGFLPETTEGREFIEGPTWYTGATEGKGAKAVWVYQCNSPVA